MAQECIKKYYFERYDLITKNFLESKSSFSVDSIHDMRVEIKRLRAFYRFVNHLDKSFKIKKHFKEIRRIFKAAGILRDIHVQMALLHELNIKHAILSDNYLKGFETREKSEELIYARIAEEFNTDIIKSNYIIIDKILNNSDSEKINNAILSLIKSLLKKISNKQKARRLSIDDLHQIRIRTKEARYNLELLLNCYDNSDLMQAFNTHLRMVHRALGKWHDYINAIVLVQHSKQRFSIDAYNRLIGICEKSRDKYLSQFTDEYEKLASLMAEQPVFG